MPSSELNGYTTDLIGLTTLRNFAVYSLEMLLSVAFAMLLIGAAIGAFVALRIGASQQTQRQLESQLEELQQQTEAYQHEVTEHFNETAELLNQLTASYRDVHNHLAKGAQTLATEGNLRAPITLLSTETEPAPVRNPDSLTPPLDYAPKSKGDAPGVLNEAFGLDKGLTPDDEQALEEQK